MESIEMRLKYIQQTLCSEFPPQVLRRSHPQTKQLEHSRRLRTPEVIPDLVWRRDLTQTSV